MQQRSAPTSASEVWVPALDGVRGLTSVTIALTHVMLLSDWIPRHQFPLIMRYSLVVVIEFFFVIGGFVAILPVCAAGSFEGVRSYLYRRVGRLVPLYYLAIALAVVLGPWLRVGVLKTFPHGPAAVLVHAAFLQELVYPGQTGLGMNLVLWSMTIAFMFYVTFPVIVRQYARHPFIGLAIGVAISIAWRIYANSNDAVFEQYPLFVADFAIGMTAAHVYVRARRAGTISPRRALAIASVAAPVFLVLMYLVGYGIIVQHQVARHEHLLVAMSVPIVFAILLTTIPFLPQWAQRPFDNPVSRFIGEISYALFLVHFVCILLVIKLFFMNRNGTLLCFGKLAAVVLPISFAVAWLLTRWVETPARRWMRARAQADGTRDQPGDGRHAPALPAAAPTI